MIDKALLVDKLKELASKDLQVRLWLQGSDNLMSSFEEAICGAFDDAGLTRAIDSGFLSKNYSDELCQMVNQLNTAVDKIPAMIAPQQVIDHPAMAEIRALSSRILELLEA